MEHRLLNLVTFRFFSAIKFGSCALKQSDKNQMFTPMFSWTSSSYPQTPNLRTEIYGDNVGISLYISLGTVDTTMFGPVCDKKSDRVCVGHKKPDAPALCSEP